MRLATIVDGGRPRVVRLLGDRVEPLAAPLPMRAVAALDPGDRLQLSFDAAGGHPLDGVTWAPAVPDPGAIFTIGANYRRDGEPAAARAERPMVLGKLPTSVAGHGDRLLWDRTLVPTVDAECELGVVMGPDGSIFGYTIVNDVNSVDPWLDGDQWLLGKSMAGFCPVGPWIVTADEVDPSDLRLGSTINGDPIQDGRTSLMRFTIAEVIAYIGRHVALQPGDLIATGTPARLATPPGPDRHLQSGDTVTCWIEGIGELTTTVA